MLKLSRSQFDLPRGDWFISWEAEKALSEMMGKQPDYPATLQRDGTRSKEFTSYNPESVERVEAWIAAHPAQ